MVDLSAIAAGIAPCSCSPTTDYEIHGHERGCVSYLYRPVLAALQAARTEGQSDMRERAAQGHDERAEKWRNAEIEVLTAKTLEEAVRISKIACHTKSAAAIRALEPRE